MKTEAKILCVDDDEVNLEILRACLDDQGYEIHFSTDGEDALKILENQANNYSAVLLDRMMPKINGLEVLKKIKKLPHLDGLPIIMQTALSTDEEIREGLEAGAHYYLTKPYDKAAIVAIVKTAVEDYTRTVDMRTSLTNTTTALQMLEEGTFNFRTPDEARSLASILAQATPRPNDVVLGLSELMLNAVEHGNLGVTYDEKTQLLNQGTKSYEDEVNRRLSVSPLNKRVAIVKVSKTNTGTEFSIMDEGQGFEWEKYLTFDPERAFDNHGRGVMLAKQLAFDQLHYQGKGNHVIGIVNNANESQQH